jgi:5-(carboxyamino)imidazole ribonucleotide mutase
LAQYVESTDAEVFICIAGLAAALPGAVAAQTIKPVIGVPKEVKLGGIDALLSIVQMPTGVPVATVGIDGAKNAALLAIEILALSDKQLKESLIEYRRKRASG